MNRSVGGISNPSPHPLFSPKRHILSEDNQKSNTTLHLHRDDVIVNEYSSETFTATSLNQVKENSSL
ncbi:hypothetical protein CEXT_767061 [Caerostris extrusa]|uniref:Uncharacterized protein n=1 Tax=Caerostris extrusa TaxID=172846 RepID=A0AAV4WTE6_CAEEX|nr:hypothetical protein CEXT_767061 [Caerostris extrusa]